MFIPDSGLTISLQKPVCKRFPPPRPPQKSKKVYTIYRVSTTGKSQGKPGKVREKNYFWKSQGKQGKNC